MTKPPITGAVPAIEAFSAPLSACADRGPRARPDNGHFGSAYTRKGQFRPAKTVLYAAGCGRQQRISLRRLPDPAIFQAMGLRFYRRIRVAPGLWFNLSKRGASVSVGARGARFTAGSRGSSSTIGIPGTGISYTATGARRRRLPGGEAAPLRAAGRPRVSFAKAMGTSFAVIVALVMVGAQGAWLGWLFWSLFVLLMLSNLLPGGRVAGHH